MAYDPRPRHRPPPQRRYEDSRMGVEDSFTRTEAPNYHWQNEIAKPDAWQSQGQRGDGFGPQDEYNNYGQNPWANDPNEHRGQYEDYAGTPHGARAHMQRPPPPRNERYAAHGPQPPRPHDQYPPRKTSQPHEDSQWSQDWQRPTQGGMNRSGSEPSQGEYYSGANRDDGTQPHSWSSNIRGPEAAESNDRLPRYMNGHAHRFSDDLYQTPLTSASSGVNATRSHDRSRPHGASISSRLSNDRPNYELGPSMGRPQTAEGYRRKGVNASHAEHSYNTPSSKNDVYHEATRFRGAQNGHERGPWNANNFAPAMYERSQTMPATVRGPTTESGLIPVDNNHFEEPGAVAGFYGPQVDGLDHGRPRAPSRSQTDDPRWANSNAARPIMRHGPPHQFPPVESRGEIVNGFQDDNATRYASSQDRRPMNQRFPSTEDEMPNFEASMHDNRGRRDMTFEDHMQPTANGYNHHQPRNGAPPNHFDGVDGPRSRSQPDFTHQRPPYGRQPGSADAARSRPAPYERPATSAGAREAARDPYSSPNRAQGSGLQNWQSNNNGREWDDQPGPNGNHRQRGPSPAFTQGRPIPDGRSSPGPWPPRSLPNRGPPRQQAPQNDRFKSPPPHRSPMSGPALAAPDNRQQPHTNDKLPNMGTADPVSKPPLARHKGQNLSLDKPLPNPDALPQHPAPERPPITSPANNRPPPVRQYNSPTVDPGQTSSSRPGGSHQKAPQVTVQELEYLRQKTLKNPNDSATQFRLAQRLVEAADVIVDDRADQASKKRNRDRFQADALKVIKKLSALSYTDADFYYADCYSRGALGLPCDIKEAFLLYQKAAKANHAQAAYRVAVCCELGQEDGGGTKRDAVKAMQWYRRAATLGDLASKYKLGVILLKGLLGQPRDPQEGVSWLKKAAESADKENPHALHELGLMHEKGSSMDGIRQDEAYARQSFTQAANLGYKFSQFRLGCAYEYGILGCPVDPRQSIAWYSKAAVQEEHQSELALSGWYLTGAEGVLQQSDTEAYLWARKAAQAGLAKAEYAMGYFTEVGIGAPANLDDAKRWYWKSASQNFPKARDRLEDLRRGGGQKQKTRVSRTNMRKQSDGECVVM